MKKQHLLFKIFVTISTLIVSLQFIVPSQINAAVSTSTSTSASSSAATSSASSSAASSAARSSAASSAASNAARSSASSAASNASRSAANSATSNASRNAMTNSVRSSAQMTQKASSTKSNLSKASQSSQNGALKQSTINSLSRPQIHAGQKQSYNQQMMSSNFINNWLFYYLILNSTHQNQTLEKQKSMMKHQLEHNETNYTITVNTKKGKRLISLPQKDYNKIKKGQTIHYKNGHIILK